MLNWRNKKDNSDTPEDFVLYNNPDDNTEMELSEEKYLTEEIDIPEDIYEDTDVVGEDKILADASDSDVHFSEDDAEAYVQKNAMSAFENQDTMQFDIGDEGFVPSTDNSPKTFYQKYKSAIWAGGATVTLGIIAAILIITLSIFTDPFRNYTQAIVAKGNVVDSMFTSGTLSANAEYSITSLVSGTVVASTPEVGDKVTAGTVLYKLDDTEAALSVKRAENQLARSKSSTSSGTSTFSIYSAETGVIQSLSIRTGSKVSAGQVVGTIKKTDDSVSAITSSVSGTVSSMNAVVGKSVSIGGLIASVTVQSTTSGNTTYDQKNNEYDVSSAKKQLANYTIKAPVTGIVTEKNIKVGDNVAMTDTDKPMMVIVDTNSLKFTFSVDEYALWDIEIGQNAVVTTDSLPEESFVGEVTSISEIGYTNQDGKTVFDVSITVDEPGNLKAGMNVNAQLILDSATNVMYLPKEALMEADGKQALVLVREDIISDHNSDNPDGFNTEASSTPEPSAALPDGDASDEELAFPSIEVPKGCRLVTVTYGIVDDVNVQIISGLKVGDMVVYDPKREYVDLSAPVATASPANIEDIIGSDKNSSSPEPSASTPAATASAAAAPKESSENSII